MEHTRKGISEEELYDISEFLRMFSEPSRLKILFELAGQTLCVNHIAERVGMTQSAVSHQLAVMRRADLVRASRRGKLVVYTVADEHIEKLLTVAREHVNEGDDRI